MALPAGIGRAGELCFRFKPGDKFSFVSTTDTKKVRYVDANDEQLQQMLRLECDFDIEEVDLDPDGVCRGAWAKYTYKHIVFNSRGKGVDMDYDSDANRPKVPPQVLPLHLARGESFFVKITPQGRIDKINGLPAVAGNAKSKIPGFADRDRLVQLVEEYFDEASIRGELEGRLAVFPDTGAVPTDIGDTWSRQERNDEDKTSLQWTWRLSQRLGTAPDVKAIIDVNLIILPIPESRPAIAEESPGKEPDVTIAGLKARREVSGRGAGQVEVDEATGRIINSTLTQDLVEKLEFLPEGPVRRTPPAPAPVHTHIVTTFKMIKRNSDQPAVIAEPNRPW
jgi:hypothetical protein